MFTLVLSCMSREEPGGTLSLSLLTRLCVSELRGDDDWGGGGEMGRRHFWKPSSSATGCLGGTLAEGDGHDADLFLRLDLVVFHFSGRRNSFLFLNLNL